jgi:hypothetical protein
MLVIWFSDHHVTITSNAARINRSIDLGVYAGVNRSGIAESYSCDRCPEFVFVRNEFRRYPLYLIEIEHSCILVPYTSLRYAKAL